MGRAKSSQNLKCVVLTISYHLYFLHISKLWSIFHQGLVHNKECYFTFTNTFLPFFCCFSSENLCFYYFRFLFWWSINKFRKQNINNQKQELVIKLPVELYALCEFVYVLYYSSLEEVWHGIRKSLLFFSNGY